MNDQWFTATAVAVIDWPALREAFLGKVFARSGSMKSRLEYDYHLRRFGGEAP